MFLQRKNIEPYLHKMVFQEEFGKIHNYCLKGEELGEKNCFGFTALEIAHLLDKKDVALTLHPSPMRKIKIVPSNEKFVKEFNPTQFKKVTGVSYLSHLKFSDYPFFKNVLDNCPWLIRNSFFGAENRKLGKRYHKEISSGQVADVTIRWINEEIGYGLYNNKELQPQEFIGEYTGVVRRLYRFHSDHNAYCFHYPSRFWSFNYFIIDALNESNEMRFVNHSDNPNLYPACVYDRGLLHLIFLAKGPICKGTHLTLDYGKDFWRLREKLEEV